MSITNPLAFSLWFVAWSAVLYICGWMHGAARGSSATAGVEEVPDAG